MLKQLRPALVSVAVFTILTGLLFPLVIFGLGQLAFRQQANGSLIEQNGKVAGSTLIGQTFTKPEYFHGRPSAAGSGYDGAASSGTNLGPTSKKLVEGLPDDPNTKDADESFAGVPQLAKAYREENGLPADTPIPADAVTRSASGLDPDISPRNAELQVARVAKARGTGEDQVRKAVADNTHAPTLGVLGEARVNVLGVNRALDAIR